MSYYLIMGKYSQDAMEALVKRPEDRLVTTTRLLHGIGGRLHSFFFSFGEYDFVMLFELPDNVSAAALSMTLNAAGTVSSSHTIVLMTMEDAIAAMRKAGEATGVYQPPGRTTS
ncbi:MAG: GYD domain-containing protein [Caldimonas sp.]